MGVISLYNCLNKMYRQPVTHSGSFRLDFVTQVKKRLKAKIQKLELNISYMEHELLKQFIMQI